MEKIIKEAMNDTIIKESIKKYGLAFEDVKYLGGFENYVYEYEKDGLEYILRFVHSHHRNFDMVLAEIEFIDYLDKQGVTVPILIHTLDDEFVFKVPAQDGYYSSVSVTTKAKGSLIKKEQLTDEFIEMFGETVGKLHRITKTYHPKHRRYHFYEDGFLDIGRRHLGKKHQFVIDRGVQLYDTIKGYEQSIDSYGLIHTDLHFDNLFYDEEKLTIFDWDDCCYKHFVSDIAIIIFYTFGVNHHTDREIEDNVITFLKPFMKGYKTQNRLDIKWMRRLNDYLMLRAVILFIVLHGAGDELINNPWRERFINKFEKRIKHNIPFFDVERVVNSL